MAKMRKFRQSGLFFLAGDKKKPKKKQLFALWLFFRIVGSP